MTNSSKPSTNQVKRVQQYLLHPSELRLQSVEDVELLRNSGAQGRDTLVELFDAPATPLADKMAAALILAEIFEHKEQLRKALAKARASAPQEAGAQYPHGPARALLGSMIDLAAPNGVTVEEAGNWVLSLIQPADQKSSLSYVAAGVGQRARIDDKGEVYLACRTGAGTDNRKQRYCDRLLIAAAAARPDDPAVHQAVLDGIGLFLPQPKRSLFSRWRRQATTETPPVEDGGAVFDAIHQLIEHGTSPEIIEIWERRLVRLLTADKSEYLRRYNPGGSNAFGSISVLERLRTSASLALLQELASSNDSQLATYAGEALERTQRPGGELPAQSIERLDMLVTLGMLPLESVDEARAAVTAYGPSASPIDFAITAFEACGLAVTISPEGGFYPPDYAHVFGRISDVSQGSFVAANVTVNSGKNGGFTITYDGKNGPTTSQADDFGDYYDMLFVTEEVYARLDNGQILDALSSTPNDTYCFMVHDPQAWSEYLQATG